MFKRLKIRFILLAMISMTATLVLAFTVVNITLRVKLSERVDAIIDTLYENDGRFSIFIHAGDEENAEERDEDRRGFMRSETPFETRYYVAYIDEDCTILRSDFGHIAFANISNINNQLYTIQKSDKSRGYIDNYRYAKFDTDEGLMIIGVDCSNDLRTIETLTMITLVTISFCVVIVFILLIAFSSRVLQPFAENRDKQRRFITDAGHELKTPIAIIRSNTEVMEMIDGESKWTKNIKEQTERMGKLVKGLVELSKMDEQTLSEKEKQRIILSEIVANSAESFSVPAQSKGITLETEIEQDIAVMGDLEDIIRVTGILLDNAIKYTDDRKIIKAELFSKSKRAVFRVSNSCKGLKKEEIAKFFDRFYRGDESRNSQTAGYGIGLSTAKMIMQNHKGRLNVSYSDDEMITFTAEFTLA